MKKRLTFRLGRRREKITEEKQKTQSKDISDCGSWTERYKYIGVYSYNGIIFQHFYTGSLLLEFTGACILIYSAVISVYRIIRVQPHARLGMAQGIAMSLCFKLGAEVLRTTIIRNESELLVLAVIIVLHAAMSALIHWEIRVEEKRLPRSD